MSKTGDIALVVGIGALAYLMLKGQGDKEDKGSSIFPGIDLPSFDFQFPNITLPNISIDTGNMGTGLTDLFDKLKDFVKLPDTPKLPDIKLPDATNPFTLNLPNVNVKLPTFKLTYPERGRGTIENIVDFLTGRQGVTPYNFLFAPIPAQANAIYRAIKGGSGSNTPAANPAKVGYSSDSSPLVLQTPKATGAAASIGAVAGAAASIGAVAGASVGRVTVRPDYRQPIKTGGGATSW